MRTQAEIEHSIRENLPIIFGKSESVGLSTFVEKYNHLLDYATAVSEPFLRADTIRYQSILLYVSLIFISLSLFQFGTIKVFENVLSVNRQLLVIYTIFIGAMTVIYLIKAYTDFQRAHIVRSRDNQVIELINEMSESAITGVLKERIQMYFWYEIGCLVDRAHNAYHKAVSEALNSSPFEIPRLNFMNLALDDLRESSELSAEIATQEKHLAELAAELAKDEARFQDEAEMILTAARTHSTEIAAQMNLWTKFDAEILQEPLESLHLRDRAAGDLQAALNKYLQKWIGARDNLQSESLRIGLERNLYSPLMQQFKDVQTVMKRVLKIRRLYAALEVLTPVAFAIFVNFYVWLTPHRAG